MATLQQFRNNFPDLRNGDAAAYNVVHVAAGIPAGFHTFPPEAAFPLPATDIRVRLKVIGANYARHIAAGGVDDAKARAMGLVLACVREGLYGAWVVENGEIVASQMRDVATIDYDAAIPAPGLAEAAVIAHYNAYTEADFPDATLAKLMRVGMGMLVCTGVVLVRTACEHHFCDPHKSVHRAVLNQVMGRNYAPPFGLTREEFEDVACHKAAHCVNSARAIFEARNGDAKVRLQAANIASAGVRIPALYASEQAASAIRKVVQVAHSLGRLANVAVNVRVIENAADAVTVNEMLVPDDRTTSTERQTRLVSIHGHDIAYCAGMIAGTADQTGSDRPPVLAAYSIQAIMQEYPSAVADGTSQVSQAFQVRRSRARRGILTGAGLFGADAPEDTDPLPADETLAQVLAAVFGARADAAAAPVP